MYQYPAHRISYQLVTFLLFHRRIFASAKKNIDFMKDSIDFGNMEIPRLFRKLLIPTVLGMVFSAMVSLSVKELVATLWRQSISRPRYL